MQASYAMGYNLAVEYLADFEKTWMLDSFKELNARVLQPQQRALKEWLFLEVMCNWQDQTALVHACCTSPAEFCVACTFKHIATPFYIWCDDASLAGRCVDS